MKRGAVIAILAAMLAACGGSDGRDAVPKPRAYPRIAVADSVFAPVPGAAIPFEACTAAQAQVDSAGRWITLSYPAYGATVYVTLSEAPDQERMAAMIDNRRERMSLNLNGAPASTGHITSLDGSFEGVLLEAPGTGTPLQFLATDGYRRLVSGVAQLSTAGTAPHDSVRPILAALRRDIIHALKNLRQ
ncbi:MAG: hypothetical protein K2L21_06775 [Muribaculaceae bacterium]|nr:hypothetical protein [Muribaculaceae bacterium]